MKKETQSSREKNQSSREKNHSPEGLVSSDTKSVIVLTVVSQSEDLAWKTLKFDKERIVLGSVVSADLKLSGKEISPIHAVIEMVQKSEKIPAYAMIFDLGSDSGVLVNQKKIVTQSLSSEDIVSIGSYQFKISTEWIQKTRQEERTRNTGGRTLFLNSKEDLAPLLLENEREIEEIFDFRPTTQLALEVVMSWSGTILAVEHFVHQKKVTIGSSRKSDFGIPPLLSLSHYPIITQNENKFILNIDTQMKGVIQKGGSIKTLDEIRGTSLRGPNGYEIVIEKSDFAKISIGEIDFYFNHTFAPPRLKMRRLFERDPFFVRVFLSSLILTALLLGALCRMKTTPQIESDQVPERIATILYQPEKFIKPLAILNGATAQQGDSTERKTIVPQSKSQPPLQQTSPAKETLTKSQSRARPSTSAQTSDQSHSSMNSLKGMSGKIKNLLGNTAAQLKDHNSQLKNLGGFTSQGRVGHVFSGNGSSETAQGAVAKESSTPVNVGQNVFSSDVGIVGSQMKVALQATGPGEPVAMGGIDRDAIAQAISAHRDEFRNCYEREINAEHPGLAGQISTLFVIGSSGRVTQAGVDSTSLNHPNTERCVIQVLKRIQFPVPRGGLVEVRFPFKFSVTR